MQKQQVLQAIENTPKGANIVLEWIRDMDARKGVEIPFSKSVRMIGRMGIEYDNMKAVKAKRESGELPAVNAGLSWGFFADYPFLIGHNKGLKKDDPLYAVETSSTAYYVRLYNGTSEKVKAEVHFFQSGVETTLREIEPAYFAAMDKAALIEDETQRQGAEKLALKLLTTLMASEVKSEKGETFTCKVENMTRINAEAEWINLIVGQVGQEVILTAEPVPARILATL